MPRFFFVFTAETRSTNKVSFILYRISDPESESEPEQSHHDSAPLVTERVTNICFAIYVLIVDAVRAVR